MFRFLIPFFLFLPLVAFAFHHLHTAADYPLQHGLAAADGKAVKPAKTDPLSLKREDLIEGEDRGWYPELTVTPEDYLEEMELPKRAETEDDTKNS